MCRLIAILSFLAPMTSALAQDATLGAANPAAVFCFENGGLFQIRTAADGSATGICLLPDGTEVDAWAYFRQQAPGD